MPPFFGSNPQLSPSLEALPLTQIQSFHAFSELGTCQHAGERLTSLGFQKHQAQKVELLFSLHKAWLREEYGEVFNVRSSSSFRGL